MLKSIVQTIVIGRSDDQTLMEVALVDTDVITQWTLQTYTDRTGLLTAIDDIELTHRTNTLIVDDMVEFLERELSNRRHGDRPDIPNVALIFVDSRTSMRGDDSFLYDPDFYFPDTDVIVVTVGPYPEAHSDAYLLTKLATNRNYALHVGDYDELASIKDDLLNLLCT